MIDHGKLGVTLLWADLPDTGKVTGKAIKKGGYDQRGEENASETVYEFRRQTVGEVRAAIAGKDVDVIYLDDFVM